MITNTSMTIYNKYIDPATRMEKYQRSIIINVYWENRKGINRSKVGDIANDSVLVLIPSAVGVNHIKPVAWQTLVTKTGKWTLQFGDVMVKGTVTDEISSTFTVTALSKKYDDVVTITSVDDLDASSPYLRHWEISGK